MTSDPLDHPSVLIAFLAVRDVPCPRCGYNLRGALAPRCPECGARLDLRVGSNDLKLGPWVSAIVATALSLGFLAFIGFFATAGAIGGAFRTTGEWISLAVCGGCLVTLGATIMLLVRKRHAFLELHPALQWTCVALIAGFDVLVLAAFLVSYSLA